jgi:hypothetical protein
MALIAGVCLIAGIAIGLAIPRSAHMTLSGANATSCLDRTTPLSQFRNVYSPDIRHDPWVRQEQLKMVKVLEQQCRVAPKYCKLAKDSREALTKD